jgi:hypothetical protein
VSEFENAKTEQALSRNAPGQFCEDALVDALCRVGMGNSKEFKRWAGRREEPFRCCALCVYVYLYVSVCLVFVCVSLAFLSTETKVTASLTSTSHKKSC